MQRKIYLIFLAVVCLFLGLSLASAEVIPDATSAVIAWTTDEPSTSQVEYGENLASSRLAASDINLVTSHRVFISGLKPSTFYHYRIKSKDAFGNEGQSQEFSFVTLAEPDKTPPLISDIEAEGVVAAGAASDTATETASSGAASNLVKKETPLEKTLIERGGLLLSKGKLQLEPSFTYAYTSANRITLNGFTILPVLVVGTISVDKVKRDILVETMTARYGLLNNLQLECRVPYRYQHDRITVGDNASETTRSASGIGDIEGGAYSQLLYEHNWVPDLIAGIGVKSKTGKSPYGRDIGLGTGHWAAKASFVAVKTADPAIIFGGLGYTMNIERNITDYGKVDPGDTINYNLGCAFALNYQLGLNFQIEQLLTDHMEISGVDVPGSFTNVINLKYGATWALSKNLSCDVSASHGLTTDSPDFVLEVRFPYTF